MKINDNKSDGEKFDIIIVGSGPAGSQCARELSKKGRKVLIIEKSSSIGRPNFSSGGTPSETFKDFDLPSDLGQVPWSKISAGISKGPKIWNYKKIRGYVMDFGDLKKFLVGEAIKNGAKVMVGTAVEEPIIEDGFVVGVKYKGPLGRGMARSNVVVDASGPAGVLATKMGLRESAPCSASIGIELVVENAPKELDRSALAFYLGDQYVPHGYGWIFPFRNNSLKVGVVIYNAKENGIDETDYGTVDMMRALEKFMDKIPQLKDVQPVDLHGGNVYANGGIKKHSKNGFLVIGDAAMQINPLGCEGIRPALHSGRIAANVIDESISGSNFKESALKEYDKNWKKYVGLKWKQSFMIAKRVYINNLSRKQWEDIAEIMNKLSSEEIFDVLFNYNFGKIIRFGRMLDIGRLIKDAFLK